MRGTVAKRLRKKAKTYASGMKDLKLGLKKFMRRLKWEYYNGEKL